MREEKDNSGDQQPPAESIEIQAVADPTTKRRGEAAEAEFIARATGLGFAVLKPWGDSDRYDVAVDHGRGFWRVQVKLATCYRRSRYCVKGSGSGKVYTKEQIDFFVVHTVPINRWYVIPIEACAGRKSLHFNPHGVSRAKFEKYREAWCLLDCTREARGWKDIPAVCRCPQLAVRCAVCPLRE